MNRDCLLEIFYIEYAFVGRTFTLYLPLQRLSQLGKPNAGSVREVGLKPDLQSNEQSRLNMTNLLQSFIPAEAGMPKLEKWGLTKR